MHRRHFLSQIAAAAPLATIPITLPSTRAATDDPPARPICTFTKFLQSLPFDQLGHEINQIGFDGLEFPLRPGGHIEPAQAADLLPQAVEAFANANTEVAILTTAITSPAKDQHAETILRTAAAAGIRHFRMGYYHYDYARPLKPQLADFGAQLKDLASLCADLGIQALYQNHSGRGYVGAAVWDMVGLLEDQQINPAHAALALDLGHTKTEAGLAWETQLHRAKDHLGSLFIKDIAWKDNNRQLTPLGEGWVDFSKAFEIVDSWGWAGPISLHVEYVKEIDDSLRHMRQDLATLQKLLS